MFRSFFPARRLARGAALAIIAALLAWSSRPASVTLYKADVYEASVGAAFNAELGSVALMLGTPDVSHAKFTYKGALDFSNTAAQNNNNRGDLTSTFFGRDAANVSNYSFISGPRNAVYGSLVSKDSYLASSGSVAGYGYGSLYVFSFSGPTAGTVLTLLHDDGVGVYDSRGNLLPGTTTGPTSAITETVTLPAGSGYQIAYGRLNGAPSILRVDVPEPVSIALFAGGLLCLAIARFGWPRSRRRQDH